MEIAAAPRTNPESHLHPSQAEDDAAAIIREYGAIEYTIDEDKRVLRKIDIRVCIPMIIIYTLSHLDKNALGYGAVFGLQKDYHMHGSQYSWLGSIIYLVQLVVQPLSAWALVRLPIAKFVIANVFIWGTGVACMAATTSWAGLMVTRAIVGAAEAPISPAFIAVVQLWWRRREQTNRNMFWLMSSPIASFFGAILAFGIGHVHHGITPYQSIFIFLGAISVVLTPLLWWMMPDDIKSARFLTQHEKAIAVERLRANNTGTKTSVWKWHQVKETFLDPKTYIWGLMLFCTAIPSSGFGVFGTLITKGFGFSDLESILFQMPIAFVEGCLILAGGWVTTRFKNRWIPLLVVTAIPMAGGIALRYVDRGSLGGLLASYYFVKLYSAIQPLLYSWGNSNAAGTTKQRTLGAILFIFQCAGNVVGPQVYLDDEAPIYQTGVVTDVCCWGALMFLTIIMAGYLKFLNKRQAKKRAAIGLEADVQDTSIMTTQEAAAYNKNLEATATAPVNQRAYEDLTDFENPEFHYVY
ncbi:major facilitator superfamily domain-containing protein [Naematelia encephala]|uniref:Major facilitator superfamily domain-containing protein n=1 Tax=Naematelia encephala TaxID=71784 RepID=A0A1Y2AZP0_9TREE|nr:major facilitator superfamily domain-containing protein [Naematelia encephala]